MQLQTEAIRFVHAYRYHLPLALLGAAVIFQRFELARWLLDQGVILILGCITQPVSPSQWADVNFWGGAVLGTGVVVLLTHTALTSREWQQWLLDASFATPGQKAFFRHFFLQSLEDAVFLFTVRNMVVLTSWLFVPPAMGAVVRDGWGWADSLRYEIEARLCPLLFATASLLWYGISVGLFQRPLEPLGRSLVTHASRSLVHISIAAMRIYPAVNRAQVPLLPFLLRLLTRYPLVALLLGWCSVEPAEWVSRRVRARYGASGIAPLLAINLCTVLATLWSNAAGRAVGQLLLAAAAGEEGAAGGGGGGWPATNATVNALANVLLVGACLSVAAVYRHALHGLFYSSPLFVCEWDMPHVESVRFTRGGKVVDEAWALCGTVASAVWGAAPVPLPAPPSSGPSTQQQPEGPPAAVPASLLDVIGRALEVAVTLHGLAQGSDEFGLVLTARVRVRNPTGRVLRLEPATILLEAGEAAGGQQQRQRQGAAKHSARGEPSLLSWMLDPWDSYGAGNGRGGGNAPGGLAGLLSFAEAATGTAAPRVHHIASITLGRIVVPPDAAAARSGGPLPPGAGRPRDSSSEGASAEALAPGEPHVIDDDEEAVDDALRESRPTTVGGAGAAPLVAGAAAAGGGASSAPHSGDEGAAAGPPAAPSDGSTELLIRVRIIIHVDAALAVGAPVLLHSRGGGRRGGRGNGGLLSSFTATLSLPSGVSSGAGGAGSPFRFMLPLLTWRDPGGWTGVGVLDPSRLRGAVDVPALLRQRRRMGHWASVLAERRTRALLLLQGLSGADDGIGSAVPSAAAALSPAARRDLQRLLELLAVMNARGNAAAAAASQPLFTAAAALAQPVAAARRPMGLLTASAAALAAAEASGDAAAAASAAAGESPTPARQRAQPPRSGAWRTGAVGHAPGPMGSPPPTPTQQWLHSTARWVIGIPQGDEGGSSGDGFRDGGGGGRDGGSGANSDEDEGGGGSEASDLGGWRGGAASEGVRERRRGAPAPASAAAAAAEPRSPPYLARGPPRGWGQAAAANSPSGGYQAALAELPLVMQAVYLVCSIQRELGRGPQGGGDERGLGPMGALLLELGSALLHLAYDTLGVQWAGRRDPLHLLGLSAGLFSLQAFLLPETAGVVAEMWGEAGVTVG